MSMHAHLACVHWDGVRSAWPNRSSAELNCSVLLRQSHALLLCTSSPRQIFLQPKTFPAGSPKHKWVQCINTLLAWLGINGFLHPCKHIHLAGVKSKQHHRLSNQGQGHRNISTPTHTQGRRWRLRELLTGIVSLNKPLKFHSVFFFYCYYYFSLDMLWWKKGGKKPQLNCFKLHKTLHVPFEMKRQSYLTRILPPFSFQATKALK